MYFQAYTAHIIFVFMIQPKQDGPPFPQTHLTLSHLFAFANNILSS